MASNPVPQLAVGAGYASGADQRLLAILTAAADYTGYDVELKSGYRKGDPRQHGQRNAIDITLIDRATGKRLPDYQNGKAFRQYEEFAQAARAVQMANYPELSDKFRWGGYFGTPGRETKYGAFDLMHFDLAGDKIGMAGGSWKGGLAPHMARHYGVANSVGLGSNAASRNYLASLAPVRPVRTASTTFQPSPAPMPANIASARMANADVDAVNAIRKWAGLEPQATVQATAYGPTPARYSPDLAFRRQMAVPSQTLVPSRASNKTNLNFQKTDDKGQRLSGGKVGSTRPVEAGAFNDRGGTMGIPVQAIARPLPDPSKIGKTFGDEAARRAATLMPLPGIPRVPAVPRSLLAANDKDKRPADQVRAASLSDVAPMKSAPLTATPKTVAPDLINDTFATLGFERNSGGTKVADLYKGIIPSSTPDRPSVQPVPAPGLPARASIPQSYAGQDTYKAKTGTKTIMVPNPAYVVPKTAAPGARLTEAQIRAIGGDFAPRLPVVPQFIPKRVAASPPVMRAPRIMVSGASPMLVAPTPAVRQSVSEPTSKWSPYGGADNLTKPTSQLRPGDRYFDADTNSWERKSPAPAKR